MFHNHSINIFGGVLSNVRLVFIRKHSSQNVHLRFLVQVLLTVSEIYFITAFWLLLLAGGVSSVSFALEVAIETHHCCQL